MNSATKSPRLDRVEGRDCAPHLASPPRLSPGLPGDRTGLAAALPRLRGVLCRCQSHVKQLPRSLRNQHERQLSLGSLATEQLELR